MFIVKINIAFAFRCRWRWRFQTHHSRLRTVRCRSRTTVNCATSALPISASRVTSVAFCWTEPGSHAVCLRDVSVAMYAGRWNIIQYHLSSQQILFYTARLSRTKSSVTNEDRQTVETAAVLDLSEGRIISDNVRLNLNKNSPASDAGVTLKHTISVASILKMQWNRRGWQTVAPLTKKLTEGYRESLINQHILIA